MDGRGAAARLSSSQLAALLERVPDIVWRYRIRPTQRFEYVSPSVLVFTGYSPAELYAYPDLRRKVVHPDDRALMEASIAAPGDHKRITLLWLHRAGLELTTEQRIVAVRNRDGEVVAL